MADEKEAGSSSNAAAPAPSEGGGSNKMLMGLLILNVLIMAGVLGVLFMSNKKQQNTQTIDQVAEGAAAPSATEAKAGEKKEGEKKEGEKKEGGEHGKEGEKGKEGKGSEAESHFFSVGDFTVNLSGPASTHYAKIAVNFETSKEVDEEELKNRKPQFRDKIIALLNSKKPADLQSTDGKNFLKEEIKTSVNTFLQKGKIEGVYFSTFIIQ